MSNYRSKIEELTDDDPRHVEAWMRLKYGTLDHLDDQTFRSEVRLASACISEAGKDESEALALSYGF